MMINMDDPRYQALAQRIEHHHDLGRNWEDALARAKIDLDWKDTKINNVRQKTVHTTKAEPVHTCSFCGKTRSQVTKIIAGPGVTICNECVGLCNEILEETPSYDAKKQALDQVVAEIELAQKHGQQCVPVSSLFWAMHATG